MRHEPRHDESGVSLVELMVAFLLFAIVVVSVDASITVVQTHQVQVSDQTQALDTLQTAQQAITRDIHAAVTWTTPAVPTSPPGSVTAQTLAFTAQLGTGTPSISIALNTSTHILTVTCTGVGCSKVSGASTTVTQAQVSNIDSSSLFTFTTKEVSTTVSSVTTNSFFYTQVASTLVLDTPKVGAQHVTKTTLSNPTIVVNNVEYSCQDALSNAGASGSC